MVERLTPGRVAFNVLNYSLMILLSIAFLIPLWHVLMASVSNPRMLMASTGFLLSPAGIPTLDGYRLVLRNPSIWTGYMNTVIYVTGTTLFGLILTLLAGFAVSRRNLRLKYPLIAFFLFTMLFSGGLIPTYMVIKGLGLIGTRGAILIPGVTNAFFIIIMKSAFEQLSPSFEESAKMDGAGPLVILVKILVPLVVPTIAVIILFSAVLQWNAWIPASIYLPMTRGLWPLQLVMREIVVQNETRVIFTDASTVRRDADLVRNLVRYSTVMVGTVPILSVYPFVQKYFVKGITLGGVKG